MPVYHRKALRGLIPAVFFLACQQAAWAGITKTVDNAPPPEKPHVPWYTRPLFKPKECRPACQNRYCPPYFKENHGYTRPHWEPWTGKLPSLAGSPVSNEKLPEGTGTTPKSSSGMEAK